MSSPGFRIEFAEQITDFFAQRLDELSPRERAHAAGVVCNTVVSLALNQGQRFSVDGMKATLSTLSDATNTTIGIFVSDESVGMLHAQSKRICEVLHTAIMEQGSSQ